MEAILVVAVGLFAVIAFANLFSWGVDCRREIRRRKRARSASGKARGDVRCRIAKRRHTSWRLSATSQR